MAISGTSGAKLDPYDSGGMYTTTYPTDHQNGSTTISWPTFRKRNEHWANIEVAINATLFFVIVFGNSIVVSVLWRRRKNLSRMHFFILNLCIADLTMAFVNTFPQMLWDITYKFYAPDFVCRLVKMFQIVPVFLSSHILVVTAIDRYIAICHPLVGLRGNYKGPMRFMIAICWIIAFICSAPNMGIFQLMDREKHPDIYWPDCRAMGFNNIPEGPQAYITFLFLSVYVIPSLILAIMYGLICCTVWKNMEQSYGKKSSKSSNWEDDESDKVGKSESQTSMKLREHSEKNKSQPLQYRRHGGKVTQAKVKTVKMTLVIVLVFVICWLPFFTVQMMSVWGSTRIETLTITAVMLLSTLNSAINPWIYFAFSGNAARDLKQFFCCCCPTITWKSSIISGSSRPGGHDDLSGRYNSSNTGPRTVYTDFSDNGRRKHQTLDAEQQATRTALLNAMSD